MTRSSNPKEERPAILEELKKKKSDRDDTVLERLKPNRPPPKPKPAPQKKKPTATENNTASQAEQTYVLTDKTCRKTIFELLDRMTNYLKTVKEEKL